MPDTAITPSVGSSELITSTAKIMADVVGLLVDRLDRLSVQLRSDGSTVALVLHVDPDDIGKVVGKHGRTARSLRVLLSSISSKTGVHFELDIQANRS